MKTTALALMTNGGARWKVCMSMHGNKPEGTASAQVRKWIQSLYLSPLRGWLRRIGATKVSNIFGQLRSWRRHLEYLSSRPSQTTVRVGVHEAVMLVADAKEYARVLSVREDRHLIRALLGCVESGDAFWDVGANIGSYTTLLAKATGGNGQVVSFEPEKRAFARLKQNISANSLKQVQCLKIALGRESGRLKLKPDAHCSSGVHRVVADGEGLEEIEVASGDEICRREAVRIPSVIKIDVEGYEWEVLEGLRETLRHPECKTVLCEIHFSILALRGIGDAPRRLVRYLEVCGFEQIVWLDPSHLMARKNLGFAANPQVMQRRSITRR